MNVAEKNEYLRNEVIEKFSNELAEAVKVESNAFVFEVELENEVRFVEVKFVAKAKEYSVDNASREYMEKVAKAEKRKKELAENVKAKAEKKNAK